MARSPAVNMPTDLRYQSQVPDMVPDLFSASSMLPDSVHEASERPDTARPALVSMREACELPDDLFGGNRRMRAKRAKWTPREDEETHRNWDIRVGRSTCFPFYRDAVCDLAARPFGRELSWDEEPPADLGEFLRDVDGSGKSFSVFARDVLLNSIHRGMDHVLVHAEGDPGSTRTATAARRVYAKRIDALSMLDIRDEVDETGRSRIVYCRFVTTRVRETDTFEQQSEVVIVELTKDIAVAGRPDQPGSRVEWTFDEKTRKWLRGEATPYKPGNKGIPLFTIYTQQTGAYAAEPVLEDLAWVNLAHYQSRSDHAHVMRIARLITLVTLGFKSSAQADPRTKGADRIALGPLSRISNSNPDAKVTFLEPSGESIKLSFQDMEHLADECKRLGARHMMSKSGNITATATTMDDKKSTNNLQAFCVRLDVLLRQVLEAVAEWRNIEIGEDIQPRVNKEFQASGNIEGGARSLMAIKEALSTRQLIIEAVRYGILRPDFPVDENLEELEKQRTQIEAAIAAAAGEVHGDEDDDEPDDEPEDEGGEE